MSGHTPGPWTLHEHFIGTARHYSVHATWTTGTFKGVEFCGVAQIPADMGDAELEANARLISAAPNLLAALNILIAHIFGPTDSKLSRHEIEVVARAAIAKATGVKPATVTDFPPTEADLQAGNGRTML